MNHRGAPITMNYQLNSNKQYKKSKLGIKTIKGFIPLLSGEKKHLLIALTALLVNTILNLASPYIAGTTIDTYIKNRQFSGILINCGILILIYLGTLAATYIQIKNMGKVGQHLLFNLRNTIFQKIQKLPIAFFNLNKAGDLISRINNDTDNLNQFFSQAINQFINATFTMIGVAVFIIKLNLKLGLLSLIPAVIILIFTKLISGKVRQFNTSSLQSLGGMSAEIQESLDNFKVVMTFNRQDYFRNRFNEVNNINFKNALKAGILNNIFIPVYSLGANSAQIIVLFAGIYQISQNQFTVGLLVSYLVYMGKFYDPMRHMAGLWASFQTALGSWDRISEILVMESDLKVIEDKIASKETDKVITLKNVDFCYPDGKEVLKKINFDLLRGKTYAFVGPTGGGKTTTASLMARLYDPKNGKILLDNKDIKSYSQKELSQKIGFILQEPFIFSGSIKENILYGNEEYADLSDEELKNLLSSFDLMDLLTHLNRELSSRVSSDGHILSLGQKQLIAFARAVLRKPEILILDEATANIDTVTEKLLQKILDKLPASTTKVIIAHRLNTIESADRIFFVNDGRIVAAGSFEQALNLLMGSKSQS
jgi:ATP-binding cassette subfamily B protein